MAKLTDRVNFSRLAPIKGKTRNLIANILKFIEGRPLTSFFIVLAVLFGLIASGNTLRKPEEAVEVETEPIQVETFTIGTAPKISYQAQIEKAGVVHIVSQTSGIVSKINVKEGEEVWRGKTLLNLSNNYLGGSAASVQRQLASVQHQHVLDTFDLQKETIGKQREISEKTKDNAEELRKIADDSAGDTRSLIDLNNDILVDLDDTIADLEATNIGGINDDLIAQTKQLKSQFLAGNSQAKASLRNLELNADEDKPPSDLIDLQKDLALKQLELQEKSLKLSKETSALQLRLAQVSESMMFPASPFEGTIERIHVDAGDSVLPGTTLVTLAGSDKAITAIAHVPSNTARQVSLVEDSAIYIGNQIYQSTPTFISQEATNGQLYSVIYTIPTEFASYLTDNSYINIEIPIGIPDASASIPFIPIDSIFQTQDETFVFVVKDNLATSRQVTLGSVTGSFVEIVDGLTTEDQVILNRNVISGDEIEIVTT